MNTLSVSSIRIPTTLHSSSSSSSPQVSSALFLSFKLSSPSSALLTLRSSPLSSTCSCLLSSLNFNHAMAELVKDKDVASAASGSGDADETKKKKKKLVLSRTFVHASSEEDLLSGIRNLVDAGRLPSNVAIGMEELYQNYKNAVLQSGTPEANDVILSNMALALDLIFSDVEDPFVFAPYHKALREPFDYYNFGQNYIRPLIDFKNSFVGNISIFKEIEEKLQQGHNIVLISNHQTEADPAVIALLLEKANPNLAVNLNYVAGDRVVTDPLCKPFSMGRNLICVYSKKHIDDVPELAEMKKKANIRSLKEMATLLRGGSQIVWIAPSGGRDRPDPLTGEWKPASFDSSSVDNMRRLAGNSGVPGHVYPLALLCHDIMPPPLQVEKEIGERRVISFHGTGLSIAPEVAFTEIAANCGNPEEAKEAYSEVLYNSVNEQYDVLKSAIQGKRGLEASTSAILLSQPWS
ncbi:hypothetical protein K2173_002854 [Erythroxylum novogranatense]|uniref:Glycerol-3-phosphate acyltransferase, chloroplastic n=1 Tax=Erythroxylum novogranatense TaxID=1862640 RepID=A0AAV8SQR7_9ROSI|nr:hypothetical protein K2173_002854 [Erythroxylum novogranatense]